MNTIETNLERIATALEQLVALKQDVPFHPSPMANAPVVPPSVGVVPTFVPPSVGVVPTFVPPVAPVVEQPTHNHAPAFNPAALFAQMGQQLPVEQITQPAPQAAILPFPQAGVPETPVPFDNVDGLRVYIIESFQKLEAKAPGTGTRVKDVMTSMGFQRVDDVPLAMYEPLYRGVEAVLRS